jgi:hypothetical protein
LVKKPPPTRAPAKSSQRVLPLSTAGDQPGRLAEPAPDRGVDHGDGGDAFEGLGDEQAPGVEPEDPGRDVHNPQRRRRLVHRDEVGRVKRAEEGGLPALGAGFDGGGIKRVGPPRCAQIPEVEESGDGQESPQRRPGPAGGGGRPEQDSTPPGCRRLRRDIVGGARGRAGRGDGSHVTNLGLDPQRRLGLGTESAETSTIRLPSVFVRAPAGREAA